MAEWSKEVEASYFRRIPADALAFSLTKPFSQSDRGQLLVEIGVVMSLFPDPPARIADMGCGTGWTSAFFARSGYEVVGTDFSPEAVDAAAAHDVDNLTFRVHDWDEDLPAECGVFDVVVFFDSLHHSEDEFLPLRTAFRCLRPDGICIACEPGVGHAESPLSQHAMSTFGVNERDMPPARIQAAGHRAGFRSSRRLAHPQEVFRSVWGERPGDSLKDRLLSNPIGRMAQVARATTVQQRRWGLVVLTK